MYLIAPTTHYYRVSHLCFQMACILSSQPCLTFWGNLVFFQLNGRRTQRLLCVLVIKICLQHTKWIAHKQIKKCCVIYLFHSFYLLTYLFIYFSLFSFLSLFKDIELRYRVVTLRHAACLIGYQFFRSHFHRGILEIKIWRNVMDVVVYEENTSFLADFRHLLCQELLKGCSCWEKTDQMVAFPMDRNPRSSPSDTLPVEFKKLRPFGRRKGNWVFLQVARKLLPFLLKRQANSQESGCYTKVAKKGKKNFCCRYLD